VASSSGFRGTPRAGSAEQKLAIESIENIANVVISDRIEIAGGRPHEDADVAAIVEILRSAAKALPVAEVARALRWESVRTAYALERGGRAGVFSFSKDAEGTVVSLGHS
jgi:hypothetical protein